MPPQATGFRYTPPNYLLRSSQQQQQSISIQGPPYHHPYHDDFRIPTSTTTFSSYSTTTTSTLSTNRLWNLTEEEAEVAMRPEDRPSRISTNMDAHFRHRIQIKQSRYRNILKRQEHVGQQDQGQQEQLVLEDHHDDVQPILQLPPSPLPLLLPERQLPPTQPPPQQQQHDASVFVGGSGSNRGSENTAVYPKQKKKNDDTDRQQMARSLLAQRLRTTLLQRTPQEVDIQTRTTSSGTTVTR
jgi:hypothetical protein